MVILRCVLPMWHLLSQSYERFKKMIFTWPNLNLEAASTWPPCSLQAVHSWRKYSGAIQVPQPKAPFTILKLGINLKRNIPHKQINSSWSPTHWHTPARARFLINWIFLLYHICLFQNHKYVIYVESFLQAISPSIFSILFGDNLGSPYQLH